MLFKDDDRRRCEQSTNFTVLPLSIGNNIIHIIYIVLNSDRIGP